MAPSVFASLLLAASAPAAALLHGGNGAERLETMTMHMYKADCGAVHGSSSVAALHGKAKAKTGPGAGMNPGAIKPFEKVLKDGFYQVTCVKDMLFTFGDKFHDKKDEYAVGKSLNVSIVHYDSFIVKEDREQMTHEVCFDFCRTIPDMNFFAIKNGRMCYCAPFFKAMESDSSECNMPCDGNPSTMCGGRTKSTVFGMHECVTTVRDVGLSRSRLSEAAQEMNALESRVSMASRTLQGVGEMYQPVAGKAGDPVAADLFQAAKVYAGELEHAAADAKKLAAKASELDAIAKGLASKDFGKPANARAAEAAVEDMDDLATQAVFAAEGLERLAEESAPQLANVEGSSKTYYPVMYFVDKDFVDVPQTCGGTPSEKPLVGTFDTCARACDDDIHECVGFQYFPIARSGPPTQGGGQGGGVIRRRFLQVADDGANGLCFLFSKMKTAQYYTGCKGKRGPVDPSLVRCMVKFSKFNGATLKPNPSGKCDLCLKEAKMADRCFV